MQSKHVSALLAAWTAWALALSAAAAQRPYDETQLPIQRSYGDWMSSGLAPLIGLVGLGIAVAAVAAVVVIMMERLPNRRRRRV